MAGLSDIRGTAKGMVTPFIGRDYFNNLVQLVAKSEKSLDMTVFQGSRQVVKKSSKTGRLWDSIARAHQKGVNVRILLHSPSASLKILSENVEFVRILEKSGVPYRLGRPDDTVHCKLVIIDGLITVCGSHNFTNRGLWDNYEASLAVESSETADTFKHYFDFLWRRSRQGGGQWYESEG